LRLDYLVPPLLVAVAATGLFIVALLQPTRSPARKPFLWLLAATMGWGIFIFLMRSSPDTTSALLWDRVATPIIVLTHILHYHFSLRLTNKFGVSRLLLGMYAALVVCIALAPTSLVITEMERVYYGYAPVVGPVGYVVFLLIIVSIVATIRNFYLSWKSSADLVEKNRLLYLLVATGLVGVGTLLEVTPVTYPTAIFANLAFCAITTVAMLRYHLLDIHIIIRKTLAYAMLSGVAMAVYLLLLVPMYLLVSQSGNVPLVFNLVFLVGLTIVFQPALRLAQNWVDRWFYRDRYDYLRALEGIGEETRNSLDLSVITNALISSVTSAMRCGKAAIVLPDAAGESFTIFASVGIEAVEDVRFSLDSSIVTWFNRSDEPLSRRDMHVIPQFQSLTLRERHTLEQMESEVIVPLKTPSGLSGIIFIGSKLSEQSYGLEEVRVLRVVTHQMAATLENARLYAYDKLTGLYNRAYFEIELRRLDVPRQLPLSIIMGDLNGLKLANDALGHEEGDRLLQSVAGALRRSCRPEDVIARWGGDEFIILLPLTTEREAMEIAGTIRQNCRDIAQHAIRPSMALGTACKVSSDQDITQALREAEDRMYRNKLMERDSARHSIISSLEQSLWETTHETEEHAKRMQMMALTLGQSLGLSDNELDELALLAALHDIGKIAIPKTIIVKPGRLTPEEWDVVRKHPEIGYRIAVSSQDLVPIAEGILTHHERWDGNGYPLRLQGEAIPLSSRIIAIIDAYDVITHGRPYKAKLSPEEAAMELQRCAGSQFDPTLVELFTRLAASQPEDREAETAPAVAVGA